MSREISFCIRNRKRCVFGVERDRIERNDTLTDGGGNFTLSIHFSAAIAQRAVAVLAEGF